MVRSALAAAFPGMDPDLRMEIPSGPALSRKQLTVDAAYSCYWSTLLQEHDVPVYVWADSSPQGGVDWLLSIACLIKRQDLVNVASAVNYLQEYAELFANAFEVDDKDAMLNIVQKRHECGILLSDCVQLHRLIPTALGSGLSSVEQKIRCVCRKLFAETGSMSALRNLLRRVRSVCADMGTEASLPDFEGASLESLLPPHMLEPELSSEVAGFADLGDAPGPAGGADDTGFVFPNTLLAPGILHIVDNMTKEIDASLPFWDTWLPGFKAIARLLHEDHLQRRLVAFCVRGTPFAWLEESFQKRVPNPAEWRWSTISAIAPHILSLRTALEAVWNPALFQQKSDDNQQQQDGHAGAGREAVTVSVDAITQAIQSKKWWLQTEAVCQMNTFADAFASWAEGCECHAWLRPSNSAEAHLKRRSRLFFGG